MRLGAPTLRFKNGERVSARVVRPALVLAFALLAAAPSAQAAFVAVGDDGTVLYSPTGLAWTPQASGTTRDLHAVSTNGTGWLAGGGDASGTRDGLLLEGAAAWTPVALPASGAPYGVIAVAWNGSAWLATGLAPNGGLGLPTRVQDPTSQLDTVTLAGGPGNWASATVPGRALWRAAATPSTWVLAGEGIQTSHDGTHWAAATVPGSVGTVTWNALTIGNGAWVAVGTHGAVLRSLDGNLWTAQAGALTGFDYVSVAYGAGGFVAGGTNGTLAQSPDGATWTPRTAPTTQTITGVAFDGQSWVAVGDSGTILLSPDGVSWTVSNASSPHPLRAVAGAPAPPSSPATPGQSTSPATPTPPPPPPPAGPSGLPPGGQGSDPEPVAAEPQPIPPAAAFTWHLGDGCGVRLVRFDDASNQGGDPIEDWAWRFGDGAADHGRTVRHTYARDGRFNVSLTVTDASGAATQANETIEVAAATCAAASTPPAGQDEVAAPAARRAAPTSSSLPFQSTQTDATRAPVWSASWLAAAWAALAALLLALLWRLRAQVLVAVLGLFSRLRQSRLLNHPLRAHIHALVQDEPGIHAREIARRVGRAWGVVQHHLDRLVAGDLVRRHATAGMTRYYPMQVDGADAMRAIGVLRAPPVRRVLAFVVSHPGATQASAARRLELRLGTVKAYVRRLREAGLVRSHRRGRHAEVVATPLAHRLMADPAAAPATDTAEAARSTSGGTAPPATRYALRQPP